MPQKLLQCRALRQCSASRLTGDGDGGVGGRGGGGFVPGHRAHSQRQCNCEGPDCGAVHMGLELPHGAGDAVSRTGTKCAAQGVVEAV